MPPSLVLVFRGVMIPQYEHFKYINSARPFLLALSWNSCSFDFEFRHELQIADTAKHSDSRLASCSLKPCASSWTQISAELLWERVVTASWRSKLSKELSISFNSDIFFGAVRSRKSSYSLWALDVLGCGSTCDSTLVSFLSFSSASLRTSHAFFPWKPFLFFLRHYLNFPFLLLPVSPSTSIDKFKITQPRQYEHSST